MTPRFEAESLVAPRFFVFNFAGVMLRDGEIQQYAAALFRRAYSTAGTAVNRSTLSSVRGEKLLNEGSQKGETDHTRRRVQLCTCGSLLCHGSSGEQSSVVQHPAVGSATVFPDEQYSLFFQPSGRVAFFYCPKL